MNRFKKLLKKIRKSKLQMVEKKMIKNKLISALKSTEGIVIECVECGNNSHTDYPYLSYHIICDSCNGNLWRHKYGSRAMPELTSSFIKTGTERPNSKGRRKE